MEKNMGIFGQTTEAMMEVYTQPYNLMKKTKLPFRLVRTMLDKSILEITEQSYAPPVPKPEQQKPWWKIW
jgi:hypothetical protein